MGSQPRRRPGASTQPATITPSSVRGVTLYRLPLVEDARGRLTAGEFVDQLPFAPLRYFAVFDVKETEVRGEHAHRTCHQFLVCLRGSVSVLVDDGAAKEVHELNEPNVGLYLPPMVWAAQYRYSTDALLLVFASDHYDPADYISDYVAFQAAVKGRRRITRPTRAGRLRRARGRRSRR